VAHVDGEARVDGLTEGKPFAKSGLKTGDVIQLIDGRGWVDADHFVRELRRALVHDPAEMRIRRDGKIVDVPVRLGEKD
jgi:S1-C subfamily serine protease